jgi:hypothetical protein
MNLRAASANLLNKYIPLAEIQETLLNVIRPAGLHAFQIALTD